MICTLPEKKLPNLMNILFVCVANSARSQLAEALAKHILPTSFNIKSAGSEPTKVNPLTIETLKNENLETKDLYSKSFNDLDSDFFNCLDFVISLCAEENCPVLPIRTKHLHWPIKDPSTPLNLSDSEKLKQFTEAKNSIENHIFDFKKTYLHN